MERILPRYIRRELAGPFLIAVGVFLFALFANRLVRILQTVFAQGGSLEYAASLMLTLLPTFLVYAIPMAFIIAILLGYGRMSADSEITALRAGGVSLWRITRPAFEVGIVLGLITMMLSIWAVPWGKHQFAFELYRLASNQINVGVQERVFNSIGEGLVLYADEVNEGNLKGVMLSDTRSPDEQIQVFAEHGKLVPQEGDPVLHFDLSHGRMVTGSPQDETARVVDFVRFQLRLDLEDQVTRRGWYALQEQNLTQLLRQVEVSSPGSDLYIRAWLEIHKNFTLPVGCLIFPFLGIPLAMTNRRAGKTQGFLTALIVIVGYYMLITVGQNAAKQEQVPIWLGAWMANIVLAGVSIWFYVRMSAGKPLMPQGRR